MSEERLSSYAFRECGSDAKIYNGIHDLEQHAAKLEAEVAHLRGALEEIRLFADWKMVSPRNVDWFGMVEKLRVMAVAALAASPAPPKEHFCDATKMVPIPISHSAPSDELLIAVREEAEKASTAPDRLMGDS